MPSRSLVASRVAQALTSACECSFSYLALPSKCTLRAICRGTGVGIFQIREAPSRVASSGAPKKSDRPPRTPPVIFLREESEGKKTKSFRRSGATTIEVAANTFAESSTAAAATEGVLLPSHAYRQSQPYRRRETLLPQPHLFSHTNGSCRSRARTSSCGPPPRHSPRRAPSRIVRRARRSGTTRNEYRRPIVERGALPRTRGAQRRRPGKRSVKRCVEFQKL